MAHWKIHKAHGIRREITVPGDKSISHRAVILSAMANGTSVIKGFLPGEDCHSTMSAMAAMGVSIEQPEPSTLIVHGISKKFQAPATDIDCGNSGTTMRLLSGILSAQPFRTRLTGDASLSRRPMKRVIDPLTRMGATIQAEGPGQSPPLVIEGKKPEPIEYVLPVASAQVKSAILLAGLFADGKTTVTEPEQTRDHTERMLEFYQVRLERNGLTTSIQGGQKLESRDFFVPGDISSAAFWLVAAAAHPNSHLLITDVGLNPTRTGILDVLVRMGGHVREVVREAQDGEPRGSIEILGAKLKGTVIEGDEIPNVIDEIPILAVAAALAEGTTKIRNARELRVKETDRIAAIATNLKAMGVHVTEFEDGLEIEGGKPLKGARVQSFGDHRIAMAFAIAGLFADGETIIEDVECVATSYPGFETTLHSILKGNEEPQTPVIGTLPPVAQVAGKQEISSQ